MKVNSSQGFPGMRASRPWVMRSPWPGPALGMDIFLKRAIIAIFSVTKYPCLRLGQGLLNTHCRVALISGKPREEQQYSRVIIFIQMISYSAVRNGWAWERPDLSLRAWEERSYHKCQDWWSLTRQIWPSGKNEQRILSMKQQILVDNWYLTADKYNLKTLWVNLGWSAFMPDRSI